MVEKGEGSYPDYDRDNRDTKRHANENRDNYEYFEKLPDELVILIFTKLSSSSDPVDTVNDIISLARCSILSKRFYELVCQVPTLTINCPSILLLYQLCPKILKKFKYITSLQVKHWSFAEKRSSRFNAAMDLPEILWAATYRPHSYCLSVVSYQSLTCYPAQQYRHSILMQTDAADNDMFASADFHTNELMGLHHMLVSSIKDHENLQRVVITDLEDGGTLILEADDLVELRNCSGTNLEQVQVRWRSASSIHCDVPFAFQAGAGMLVTNVRFHLVEWCEKTTNDQINVYDDDDGSIPSALAFRGYDANLHKCLLHGLLNNPHGMDVNPNKVILDILSFLKSEGSLV